MHDFWLWFSHLNWLGLLGGSRVMSIEDSLELLNRLAFVVLDWLQLKVLVLDLDRLGRW